MPGGTVIWVETDSDGVYEAHFQKADGSIVRVKFDKNVDVTGTDDGFGRVPGYGGQTAPSTAGSNG